RCCTDDAFDGQFGSGQFGLAGGACVHVVAVDPFGPDGVHAREVAFDVLEPDLDGEELRFVGAGLGQVTVDLGKDVAGLCLDVVFQRAGRDARNVGDAVVDDDAAEAFVTVDALNFGGHAVSFSLNRVTRNGWMGRRDSPCSTRSVMISPMMGLSSKPCAEKPKAWKTPGLQALGPMTGVGSGR